jgi:hypothetical protein
MGDGHFDVTTSTASRQCTKMRLSDMVHFDKPIAIKIDGSKKEGVVLKPKK